MNTIKNTFLSNFWECSVEYGGLRFNNSEAAFQAQKCADGFEQYRFVRLNGAEAKALGKKVRIDENWEDEKWDIMFNIVEAKFNQNKDLARMLAATGDEEIIEGNTWGDTYWGVCNGIGKNNLGKILMSVRGMIQEEMNESNNHWEVIAKMYSCPECGWVTECYPNCPIK